ncbi:AraC family transcriptional regulator [Bradyrhizobium roseum]|uniref:AraC family transcriptional regulator n=1 Tax=Bradyrhizobium roseum TaxID=3056648 RepID=UPI00262EF212|nr:AraC family transcriptional regulator [Bradyrhizobium roseus]WKA28202.1 AraC family transcriptional regulator [Bradyrhizobium roseus]
MSVANDETATPGQRFTLASDDLPAHLDDRARLAVWQDRFAKYSCKLDISPVADRPFSIRCELARFQEIGAIRLQGTVDRFERPARYAAIDGSDDLILCLNQGGSVTTFTQSGRDATIRPGSMLLATNTMGGRLRSPANNPSSSLFIPRRRLGALVANVDDLLVRPVDAEFAPVRFLGRYLQLLFAPDDLGDEPALLAHIGTTMTDLIALAFGTGRDARELARMRGLRAARAHEILRRIAAGFSRPSFRPAEVAHAMGLSSRYVNELMQESGVSFAERVMELRLQKARALLTGPPQAVMRVGDIAYACGFNEVSYFNRCFRRRFGVSPTRISEG